MKNTIKIKVYNELEYEKYSEMLLEKGFVQIGTRMFEDEQSYVKILIEETYEIYYTGVTASGNETSVRRIEVRGCEEANRICDKIEKEGYKLKMINIL